MIIGIIITGIGAFFLLLGSFGIVRLPDVYNRLQAGTKCTTLGAFCAIIGVGIMMPQWFAKTLLIALFILITNPISNHVIGRAGLKRGIPLCKKSIIDKTKEFNK